MTTPADPKAAEREAAIRWFLHIVIECRGGRPVPFTATARERHSEDCDLYAAALRTLLATRERDAAAGALREAEDEVQALNVPVNMGPPWASGRRAAYNVTKARRLALEQGTPATCASCGKPMEGERFTVQASVRADLVGKTVGRCCWPPDHGAEGYGEGTPATCPTCKGLPGIYTEVPGGVVVSDCPACARGTPATREETP